MKGVGSGWSPQTCQFHMYQFNTAANPAFKKLLHHISAIIVFLYSYTVYKENKNNIIGHLKIMSNNPINKARVTVIKKPLAVS